MQAGLKSEGARANANRTAHSKASDLLASSCAGFPWQQLDRSSCWRVRDPTSGNERHSTSHEDKTLGLSSDATETPQKPNQLHVHVMGDIMLRRMSVVMLSLTQSRGLRTLFESS